MGLYEDLVESVKDFSDEKILDVRLSNVWTAVKTKNVGLSLAYSSFYDEVEDAGYLISKSAKEILNYLYTFNLTKVSIGLATLNSLIPFKDSYEIFNILDYIESIAYGKKVVFVGHFCGLDKIRTKAKELIVLERNPKEGDTIDTAFYYLIPEADILAITGSTLANKSIEALLSVKRNAHTIVFGPSTPPSEVLFDYGVDVVGASYVKNNDFIINAVSQGGKLNNFKKFLDYVVLRKQKF